MNEDPISERLTNIEAALAHLQKDFDALNEAILLYSRRFETMQGLIDQMSEQIEESKSAESPVDPVDEKPPHY